MKSKQPRVAQLLYACLTSIECLTSVACDGARNVKGHVSTEARPAFATAELGTPNLVAATPNVTPTLAPSAPPTLEKTTNDSASNVANLAPTGTTPTTTTERPPIPPSASKAAKPQPSSASIGTASAPPRLETVQGAVQVGEGYRVYLHGPSPIRVGETKAFTVVIEPQAPFKSNDKYPYRFAGLKTRGVSVSSDATMNAHITPSRTTLQVNVTGAAPGAASLEGTLGFSVCTDEKCLIERATLEVSFSVI